MTLHNRAGKDVMQGGSEPRDARVARRIEEWKRKLVDLSRRNRLLFFRPSRTATLRVVDPSPEEVFERFAIRAREWQFWAPSPEEDLASDEQPKNLGLFTSETERELEGDFEGGEPVRPGRRSFEVSVSPSRKAEQLACNVRDPAELVRILKNLHRRSRTDFEERGVRILHLAFGVLEWRETENNEPVRSPLVLVPAELVRESAQEPFELRPVEEDAVLNPALDVKLRNDFRIELPPIPEDWDEVRLQDYLNEIAKRVKRQGWSVALETWIGLFSFHKLVIYRDLSANGQAISSHAIVRGLAGAPADDAVSGDAPAAQDADRWHTPRDSFLVVDADSSQLACIEAVKRGTSLVLHGPPGTGKSQTITNVIAESVAAGKTVLFVSEKMAALEVVYKRLREAHLEHFCLELHSHRANKRAVVQELHRCLEENLEPKGSLSAQELETLVRRRQQLCDYVHALHLVREPMVRSTFDILAELSGLHEVPLVPFDHPDVASLSPSLLARIGESASRLQTVWRVALEGTAFPWLGCVERAYTAATRTSYQQVLERCIDSVGRLSDASRSATETIGVLPAPPSLQECSWLAETLRLLATSPRPEPVWLVTPDLDSFVEEAQQLQALTATYRDLFEKVATRHGTAFLSLPSSLREQIKAAHHDTAALLQGESTDERALLAKAQDVAKWAQDLAKRAAEWETDGLRLADLFGLPSQVLTTKRLSELIRLVELCAAEQKPDKRWLDPRQCREVTEELPRLRDAYSAYRAGRDSLRKRYSEGLFGLDLDRLVEAFSGRHASRLRWLRLGFYRDRRAIARCSLDGRVPRTARDDLILARDAKQRRAALDGEAQQVQALIGAYYRGYDTDFERVRRALAVTTEALSLAGRTPLPVPLRSQLALDGMVSAEARDIAVRIRDSLSDSLASANQIGAVLSVTRLPTSSLPLARTPLLQLREWATTLAAAANRLGDGVQAAARASAGRLPETTGELLSDLDMVCQLRELDTQIAGESERLKRAYGERFCGMGTSWEDVLTGLEWADRARRHFRGREITRTFIEVAVKGPPGAPGPDSFDALLRQAEGEFATLEGRFEEPPALDGVALRDHPFERVLSRLSEMVGHLDDIRDWVDFQSCRTDFVDLGLDDLFAQLEARMPTADLVPQAVRRAVLQKWVEHVFEQEPSLGRFRGEDHEKLIAEFRELDRRHWQVGAHRVIAEANKHKPHVEYVPTGSEISLLKHEALKKRRHLPIRKLFDRIPLLVTQLKPCLLMSPVSASQFLSATMKFDLIVFDEASQICTEDAVGAIYRGTQLLVCGDRKQLPPTAFFQAGMSEEFDEDEPGDQEEFEPLDSVLDECLAMNMREGWLRWHYRSRHESLIAFSNSRFYDSRLVTFPSCFQEHEDLGIKFVHVADGIYDRGGKRDNVREAEVVADLVFEHFLRRHTSKSLGVVAFSQAQMESIEDEIERRVRERPEMERYFTGDRMEGFFVKNLENVQGDERDVMVFSIGYGRDRAGRMTMNFGPLNQAGGERRLNVAVTRAREKVILVSSIRAADIDLAATQAPGVLMFHRYLDYAERGVDALELTSATGGDFESPLEKDVAQAVRQMGFDIVPQVGCSGFRIDLGVVEPAQPGRFILGIECDGVSYHSSYVARDKDRLRQEVLERLGWRIHRIWSPDWVNRRTTEVERLRTAIEQARNAQASAPGHAGPCNNPDRPGQNVPFPAIRTVEIDDENNVPERLSWAMPYQVSRPKAIGSLDPRFHLPEHRLEQVRLVEQIVAMEGPIHVDLVARRLAQAWGLQRVGNRIQAAANEAIRRAGRGDQVRQDGEFLWPADKDFRLTVRTPTARDEETVRKVEHIPAEEIALAMKHIVRAGIGISSEALFVEVARVFGFERTGHLIRGQLDHVLRNLVEEATLVQRGDLLHLGNAGSCG
jgi:very-short-patch-repair endonuclease